MQMNNQPDMRAALGSEDQCRDTLTLACEHAGIEVQYPVGTSTAAAILRGAAFDVDANWLRNFAASGGIPSVIEKNGQLLWPATAVFHAACLADQFRRWMFCDAHLHKFCSAEVLELQAEAAGESSVFQDHEHVASRDLLWMIAQSNDRDVRMTLAVGLAGKLKRFGVADK